MTQKVNHSQLREALFRMYDKKMPLFIWGGIGIGKSDTVRDVAKEIAEANNLKFLDGDSDGKGTFGFVDCRASQLDPSDIRGLPKVDGDLTVWLPPEWLPHDEAGAGILFFDELNQASPSVQKSLFQLILNRRIGSYKLPENWTIVSAGNHSDDRADVFDMPAPLCNRFAHLELNVPSKEEWLDWASAKQVSPALLGFIALKPSLLYSFDNKRKDKAFPSPRSIYFASKLITGDDSKSLDDQQVKMLVSSVTGEGFATEFIAFRQLSKKISISEVLAKPELVEKITDISLKYSLISGLVEAYKENPRNLSKILKTCEYMIDEFAILLLRLLKSSSPNFINEASNNPVFTDLSHRYIKHIAFAG